MWYDSLMRFRDDIDPATTWLVADSHFGHENIKAFCHRPDDIEQIMMEKWARMVPNEDTVLHLGDLSYRSNAFFKNMIAPHLTGARKLLIQGNHDKQRFSFYRDSGFNLVKPFKIEYIGGNKLYEISFSHYPWNEQDEGPMPGYALRIHGHIHNNGYSRAAFVPYLKQHINVSIEMMRYKPVRLKHLLDGYLLGWIPEEERRREINSLKEAINADQDFPGKGQLDPRC